MAISTVVSLHEIQMRCQQRKTKLKTLNESTARDRFRVATALWDIICLLKQHRIENKIKEIKALIKKA